MTAATTACPEPAAPLHRTDAKAKRRSNRAALTAVALLAASVGLIGYKFSGWPGSAALANALSFEGLPPHIRPRAHHLLFTPLGALVVVFARLTLGLRVLGPFRSVLLAIAFQITGSFIGLGFYALVLGAVTVLRPVLKSMKLAYFGRQCSLLISVAGIIMLGMLAGLLLGIPEIERVAYFPVVVLTLAGEAFASTMRKEGAASALWRAGATALVALAISSLATIGTLQDTLVRFPELVLAVLALTILTARFMGLRLLKNINPPVKKKRKKSRAAPIAAPVNT